MDRLVPLDPEDRRPEDGAAVGVGEERQVVRQRPPGLRALRPDAQHDGQEHRVAEEPEECRRRRQQHRPGDQGRGQTLTPEQAGPPVKSGDDLPGSQSPTPISQGMRSFALALM